MFSLSCQVFEQDKTNFKFTIVNAFLTIIQFLLALNLNLIRFGGCPFLNFSTEQQEIRKIYAGTIVIKNL